MYNTYNTPYILLYGGVRQPKTLLLLLLLQSPGSNCVVANYTSTSSVSTTHNARRQRAKYQVTYTYMAVFSTLVARSSTVRACVPSEALMTHTICLEKESPSSCIQANDPLSHFPPPQTGETTHMQHRGRKGISPGRTHGE